MRERDRPGHDEATGEAFDLLPHAVMILRDGVVAVTNRRARMLLASAYGCSWPWAMDKAARSRVGELSAEQVSGNPSSSLGGDVSASARDSNTESARDNDTESARDNDGESARDNDGESALGNEAEAGLGADANWPVGQPIDAVARFVDEAGRHVELPSHPPVVGDRYAERIVSIQRPTASVRPAPVDAEHDVRESRPLAMEGCWAGGDLVLTLRNAARRGAAVRRQGDVVATVAHEIRSPLTSVKGFTRTLLARWDRFSDEEKRTMLATIEQDADRVTRLLTDLLEVSRIDAGRVQLHRSRVDVGKLIQSVVDKAGMRSDLPEIAIVVGHPVPLLDADRDKLEQVLTNLLDNALIHAKGSPVTVTAASDGAELTITVADRGPGIDPAAAPQLFRKFGRGRQDNRAGTGLGLFLAKGLVEAHGGRIWFDPHVAIGASVHVAMPLPAR